MGTIIRLLEKSTKSIGWIFAWLILPLVLSLTYEVFARYVVGRPTTWSYEISYMLMAAIFLLGAAYTLADGGHIRIDFLYVKFSPKRQAVLDLIGYLIIFLPVIFIIAYSSAKQAIYSFNTSEVSDISPWRPPMWPFRTSIALGFILLSIQGIAETMKKLIKLFGQKIGEGNG